MTSRRDSARDTQAYVRPGGAPMPSRCSGSPSTTASSQLPQTPSRQPDATGYPAYVSASSDQEPVDVVRPAPAEGVVPYRDAVGLPVGRVAAQRVLPGQPVRQHQVDMSRPAPREPAERWHRAG